MVRNKQVISIYEELKNSEKYSDFFHLLPRSFIYDKIKEQTGLCHKTIADILNHREKNRMMFWNDSKLRIICKNVDVLTIYVD